MIEIINEHVEMPVTGKRYEKDYINYKWVVRDSHSNNEVIYKGKFEDVVLSCHNLNKKYYGAKSRFKI